ncbi:MAG: hypothetical protein H5U04_02070, partial [Firmicutes bacterium]|nr:hypothetical protein [Bacillota bacterium]
MNTEGRRGTGYALAALAASLWGTLGILGTILGRYGLSPVQVATLRAGTAFVLLGLVLAAAGRRHLRVKLADLA